LCNIDFPQLYVTDRGNFLCIGLCLIGCFDCCNVDGGICALDLVVEVNDGTALGTIDGTFDGIKIGTADGVLNGSRLGMMF
jgi:hypothetical protein